MEDVDSKDEGSGASLPAAVSGASPVFLDGLENSLDQVISGHRDTHFRFLQQLETGDRVQLTLPGGSRWYEIVERDVIDSRSRQLVLDPGMERLSLVTCYPFDTPTAVGPLRYVVTALPVTNGTSRRSPSSG